MFELPNLHLHVVLVCFVDWQREILHVDVVEPVEPFRADHSELLVLVGCPTEQFLRVQELLINPEGTQRDTVIAEDLLLSDFVSVRDCEHCARRRHPLVRTSPTQNC